MPVEWNLLIQPISSIVLGAFSAFLTARVVSAAQIQAEAASIERVAENAARKAYASAYAQEEGRNAAIREQINLVAKNTEILTKQTELIKAQISHEADLKKTQRSERRECYAQLTASVQELEERLMDFEWKRKLPDHPLYENAAVANHLIPVLETARMRIAAAFLVAGPEMNKALHDYLEWLNTILERMGRQEDVPVDQFGWSNILDAAKIELGY